MRNALSVLQVLPTIHDLLFSTLCAFKANTRIMENCIISQDQISVCPSSDDAVAAGAISLARSRTTHQCVRRHKFWLPLETCRVHAGVSHILCLCDLVSVSIVCHFFAAGFVSRTRRDTTHKCVRLLPLLLPLVPYSLHGGIQRMRVFVVCRSSSRWCLVAHRHAYQTSGCVSSSISVAAGTVSRTLRRTSHQFSWRRPTLLRLPLCRYHEHMSAQ